MTPKPSIPEKNVLSDHDPCIQMPTVNIYQVNPVEALSNLTCQIEPIISPLKHVSPKSGFQVQSTLIL